MTDNKQYPELPTHFMLVQESFRDEVYLYTADQMRAYVDADRAMRAANAKPVAWRRLCYREWEYEDGITSFEHDPSAQALYTEPQATPASQDAEDSARLDWLTFNLSGAALRAIGVEWSEHGDARRAIDAARAAKEGEHDGPL